MYVEENHTDHHVCWINCDTLTLWSRWIVCTYKVGAKYFSSSSVNAKSIFILASEISFEGNLFIDKARLLQKLSHYHYLPFLKYGHFVI